MPAALGLNSGCMDLLRHITLCVSVALVPAWAQTPPSVATVEVGRAASTRGLAFDAVVQPLRQAVVTAQVAGNVLALAVKPGDAVRRGQLLARLDDRESRAQLDQTSAALAQAQAQHQHAQLVLERQRALLREQFVSQAALDLAQAQFAAAAAAVQQARAARAAAEVVQGQGAVLAPFDAVVLATMVDVGDLAQPGRALLSLYEPGRLRAVVQVPQSMLAAAKAAKAVRVVVPQGATLTPVASEWLPGTDPVSQTVEWRLSLPTSAGVLRPGEMVRVMADAGQAAAPAAGLMVPASAVLRRGELTAVFVAQPQGFVLRAVRVAATAGDAVEVLAGLRGGERVAVDAVRAGLRDATPQR